MLLLCFPNPRWLSFVFHSRCDITSIYAAEFTVKEWNPSDYQVFLCDHIRAFGASLGLLNYFQVHQVSDDSLHAVYTITPMIHKWDNDQKTGRPVWRLLLA